MNDGDIIQDKALIDKILENCTKKNQKNNFNQTNNEELIYYVSFFHYSKKNIKIIII